VREAASALAARHAPLDVVVCNAGIAPQRFEKSPQGYELAFATNVLGHFALLRRLIDARALARGARVVVVTGDIYVLASDCTPDYAFRSALGGMQAYCRSKLGNIWIARELQRRHPELHVAIAHPGVVATGLGGAPSERFDRLRRRWILPIERGAETPLFCATQSVAKGAYIHNTLGEVTFEPGDLGGDSARAAQLWECCEALAST
jgi:NAD(P)-dependent dehydrogenase (short-subunit alcohol dehydrogenase family)